MPRHLVAVVGVGMAQTAAGVTLELLSIERYREGLVVLFRMLSPEEGQPDLRFPELRLSVADGPVAGYTIWPMSGGGGGGRDGVVEHRLSYSVIPAPTPSERTVLEVSTIGWRTHGMEREPEIDRIDTGPWRFIVEPGV